jgi:hypothetical protein
MKGRNGSIVDCRDVACNVSTVKNASNVPFHGIVDDILFNTEQFLFGSD